MTQCELIMDYIKSNGSITSMEAFSKLGVTRLSARIFDLRKAGENIVQERRYYRSNGRTKHYDIFTLGEAENEGCNNTSPFTM